MIKSIAQTLPLLVALHSPLFAEPIQTDVCIYGGTSGGVVAAVKAARI
jgi:predicted ATP-dependent Lon-type protease